jgi:hypothetical protein
MAERYDATFALSSCSTLFATKGAGSNLQEEFHDFFIRHF